MGLFPQNSYQVIDQCCRVYNHFWFGCVLLKLHVGNVFFLYDTCTEYNTTSCRNSIRLLTFQKSSRKNFLTFHEYTCNDTVTTMIVTVLLKFVLKTNYLHIRNEFFIFLRLTSIIYVFSNIDKFQFFFRIKFLPHLCRHTWGVTLDGVLAFGKGDEMVSDLSNT